MKTEVREVQIAVEEFTALIRDGELNSIDNITTDGSWKSPVYSTIQVYIKFLQEILAEIEE